MNAKRRKSNTKPQADADPGLVPLAKFSVAGNFEGYPKRSIDFAQSVLDEVKKLKSVNVAREKNGIKIEPNFVWIEYLLKRSGRFGIRVSFYNRKKVIMKAAPDLMNAGFGSYCRCLVESTEVLKQIRPFIRKAYELKFGKK
jgi:hypothetical protein